MKQKGNMIYNNYKQTKTNHMTYRQSQIKDLQKVIDQHLLGHYKINHARMKHPEPNGRMADIEWFELLEFTDSSYKKQTVGTMSTPTWEEFQSEIISMLAVELSPNFPSIHQL